MKKSLLLKIVTVVFVVVGFVGSVSAQVTTSSMTGTVRDSKGALPGASIKARHTPTGTTYSLITNNDGRYTIGNMRVGGPYTVEISFVGFKTQTISDVFLKLAEPFVLNVTLQDNSSTLAEVKIIGAATNSIMNSNRNGATTNISNREIQVLPSITRSLNDLTRLTPQANGTSIGGGNYRQNNFTVDGSEFNNNFGIGGNLPANGSPISLDALEQISINVTPYDVTQGNFIGSSMNAVTRSGTNQFSGSVYTYFRNQNQQGRHVGNFDLTRGELDDKTYGARFGGPIIKNKLFFFMNVEQQKTTRPGQQQIAATTAGTFGNNVSRPTVSDLNKLKEFLINNYGYDPGVYQGYSFAAERLNLLGRIDWNINDKHKLNIRYSQVESKDPSMVNNTSAAPSSFSSGAGRTGVNSLQFSSANYYQEANFYSLSGELNSQLGRFTNTLRASYTNQNDPRSSDSDPFPFVDILEGGTPYTSFGYELFTYGNLRDVKTTSIIDNLKWSSGKHNFTAGFQLDFNSTTNGFQRYGTSYYRYNSLNDFLTNQLPANYALTYSLEPGYAQAFPNFKSAQYSVYGQDEIQLTDRFKFAVGLRLDLPTYPKAMKEHPLLANQTFANGMKLSTAELPKANLMFSPRASFNWDVKGDRSVQVRGGSGIFTGKFPFVWIVNQAGDAGLLQVTETWGAGNTSYPTVPGVFNPDPNAYRPATQPAAGTILPSAITVISPDLKMPQTWKTSLAIDAKLPGGVIGTLEGIYNSDINTAFWNNVNLKTPSALNVSGYADNRVIYPNSNSDKYIVKLNNGQPSTTTGGAFNTYRLENGSKGHYYAVTAKLEKQFSNGFAATLAYTKSGAKNLYDGSGDQAGSAWAGTPTVNGSNSQELSYASYVVPNRVVASISYGKEFFKHAKTTLSLFYQGSIDGRFSYVYGGSAGNLTGDINRDGANADLIYIPKDASEIDFEPQTIGGVVYSNQAQKDLFFRYIEQDAYLSSRKGQYAERNGAQFPWRNQVDVKLLQDIFVNVGGKKNSLQFTWDIFNVGNFINKNWGLVKQTNQRAILNPRNAAALTPGGATKPLFWLATDRGLPITSTFRDLTSISSTYYMQFGFRYTFN
ncbi:TonB-dependent receptor [Pedobacter sp. UBA4863]|uniref:TonB-dependent receptor n=1 Tax=Pedobacter sp. UBA4863 TaxID=1947060 RepID=UPI0025F0294C|nr:TonB-dependent receptor [Pedobacter sp. UBA4863]